ncbi:hypothetical protein FA15DRAFT_674587 [Coprinopsis marcescibilis]|uniref:Uncharacterized protein n=1 Tax=Coprinopsis marcescibilis TaxID=230819 RepID=A0A5C3KHN2_COPMA|nr:hypothetical protein FA15DRAFT_674587 [Coprinopsis marcescibilis]
MSGIDRNDVNIPLLQHGHRRRYSEAHISPSNKNPTCRRPRLIISISALRLPRNSMVANPGQPPST